MGPTLGWISDQKNVCVAIYVFLFSYKDYYWVSWQNAKHTHNSHIHTCAHTIPSLIVFKLQKTK